MRHATGTQYVRQLKNSRCSIDSRTLVAIRTTLLGLDPRTEAGPGRSFTKTRRLSTCGRRYPGAHIESFEVHTAYDLNGGPSVWFA